LIPEELTSVNISRHYVTRSQDLVGVTTPALLPNSPEQELAASLYGLMKNSSFTCKAYSSKEE
jgi:hypothetical protein